MLHGREAERETLAALLDGARASRSGVLVLRGEAGMGKSALIEDTVEQAADMRLLRAVGVESESELAYAGLHQVAWPLLDRVDELAPPQASALQGALGLTAAAGFDRFLVSAAVLSLLAAAAEEQPVLCVIDDAHWLDEPSADALTFAARRFHAEPVVLLFAARDGEARPFEAPGLPELRLEGLSPDAAGELLAERAGAPLPAELHGELVEATAGNPLALLELPRALTDDQLAGREPLGELLPVTDELEDVYLSRAKGLPEGAKHLLVVAAADDTGEAGIVLDAAGRLGLAPDDAEVLEAAGLLRIGSGSMAFRHPLVRSAVYQGASFTRRRRAHEALAEVLQGERYRDRRAWHLAAAAAGPDPEVADELEASAERARRRSGYGAAAAALARAAALTAEDELRAQRLAAGAEAAWLAGRPARARAWLESARRLTADPLVQADVDHLRGLIELQHGVPADAHEIVLAAEAKVAPIDPRRAAAMLVSAGEAAAFAGLGEGEIEAGRRAALLRSTGTDDLFELSMMAGIGSLLGGDAATGAPLLREAITAAEASDNPRRLFWAGSSSLYLLDESGARSYFSRAVEETRAEGAISMLALALQMLAYTEILEGRFASAEVNAAESLRLARETGQENSVCQNHATLACTAAFFGREEDCRAHAAEVFELAHVRGLALQATFATWALAELELGAGRPEEALVHFERLAAPEPGRSHPVFKPLTVPGLVEAAVHAGRLESVDADVDAFEAWVTSAASCSRIPLAARCRALLASGEEAFSHYESALELHAESQRPFETARTRFLYGEALRRARRRREAREHLRAALEAFEQLGAAAWAERARAELRASGETARKRDPSTVDQLTPQELQIARLVASGASNKEVAAQLFLSPRTIDFHLRNVYSKLGISSRHELPRLGLAEPDPAITANTPAISPVRP